MLLQMHSSDPKFKSHPTDVRLFVQENTMASQNWELSPDLTDLRIV